VAFLLSPRHGLQGASQTKQKNSQQQTNTIEISSCRTQECGNEESNFQLVVFVEEHGLLLSVVSDPGAKGLLCSAGVDACVMGFGHVSKSIEMHMACGPKP